MNEEKVVEDVRLMGTVATEEKRVYSEFLQREVLFDIYRPGLDNSYSPASLLFINDGQDLRTMDFQAILEQLMETEGVKPVVCIGIHCSVDRLNEYGTAYSVDYMGRGGKAGRYTKFILNELLPYLEMLFNRTFSEKSFAGFSLGGLSALDIVWNNAAQFKRAGIFSASLWWRRKGYDDGYDNERDRMMHLQVQKGKWSPSMNLYFQTGRLDETADRNHNGIIDSIEDATDLIRDLMKIGFTGDQLRYVELEDGEHTIQTWARALPDFIRWGWGKSSGNLL